MFVSVYTQQAKAFTLLRQNYILSLFMKNGRGNGYRTQSALSLEQNVMSQHIPHYYSSIYIHLKKLLQPFFYPQTPSNFFLQTFHDTLMHMSCVKQK